MTNPHFTAAAVPGSRTKARSVTMREEFSSIEAGFDAVETSLLLKAPKASPVFSGTLTAPAATVNFSGAAAVTAPTVSVGDNSTNVATTAFAVAVLGAAGSLIPPQATHAGKVLTTDGTSYSWQIVPVELPSQTGNSRKTLTTDGSNPSWRNIVPWLDGGYAAHVADATLTVSSPAYADLSAATGGVVVTLPDARTLSANHLMSVDMPSGSVAGIATSGGELLPGVSSGFGTLLLTDNSTAAGSWMYMFQAQGFESITMTAQATVIGSLVSLRSGKDRSDYVEVSDGVYLCVTGAVAGSGVDVFVTSRSGMTFTNGSVTTVGTDTVAWIRVFAVSGGYLCLYATTLDGAIKGIGITVSGTTASAGSATTVLASISTAGEGDEQAIKAESNGTDVCLIAKTSTTVVTVIMADISGTTVNVGTSQTLYTGAGTITAAYIGLCSLSASRFGLILSVYDGTTRTQNLRSLTYSGLTITLGTNTSSSSAQAGYTRACSVLPLSSTSMLVCAGHNAVGDTRKIAVASAMDTTPVENTGTQMTIATGLGTLLGVAMTACGSTYAAMVIGSTTTKLYTVTVSGVTVTEVGTALSLSSWSHAHPLKPYWDGQYLHIQDTSQETTFRLYNVSGSGLGINAVNLGSTLVATSAPGATFNYRISGQKYAVAFSSNCSGRILRFKEKTA